MKVFLLFLCLCGSIAFASSSSKSSRSSSSSTYKPPQCEMDDGFYCPGYFGRHSCPSRTLRCTGDESESECLQKTYDHCNYISSTGKFKVLRYSTPLSISSNRRAFSDLFTCLKTKPEHHFIVYRGLMYEYGDYGARIQDPNDPNYEYRPDDGRSTTEEEYLGESSCTYEEVLPYLEIWKSDEYRLCTHNCQDFAKGLAMYLNDGCKTSDSSSDEMAEYVFSIASDGKCTTTLDLSSAGSLQISAAFIAVIIFGTFFILF